MEFRTILAAVSGGSASAGVLAAAAQFAKRFGSHLEAFHARIDARELVFVAGDGMGGPVVGDLIEATERDAKLAADRARTVFDTAVRNFGLSEAERPPAPSGDPAAYLTASACWREEIGYSATKIADRARLFDLLVLGRSGRVVNEPYSDAIEEALLTSGRPVLVAPGEPVASLGNHIAVAWNNSAESAHALAAAMPLLRRAHSVHLLGLGDTGCAELVQHLGWYGVRASAVKVAAIQGVGTGELLLAAARDCDADLLVMGGYGHAPWRELLFGGATRQIIGTSLLPLLLAH
jgi:nucleotide-binding universal stress UspA family protein